MWSISTRLSRKLVAGVGRDEGGGSCGDLWPEEDVVSEVVEAPDEVGRGALGCLLVEERLSEFLERNGGFKFGRKHRSHALIEVVDGKDVQTIVRGGAGAN